MKTLLLATAALISFGAVLVPKASAYDHHWHHHHYYYRHHHTVCYEPYYGYYGPREVVYSEPYYASYYAPRYYHRPRVAVSFAF